MTELLTEVTAKYVDQLHATILSLSYTCQDAGVETMKMFEVLGGKANSLPLSKAKLEKMKNDLKMILQDMTAVDNSQGNKTFLLETYLWTAVCLLGFSLGQFLGASFIGWFIGLFFNTGATFLLTLILPVLFYLRLQTGFGKDDAERRLALLSLSVILGALTGYNLSHLHLAFNSPLSFVMPLTLGLAASFLRPEIAKDRRVFLGTTVGFAVFIHFLWGVLTHSLGIRYLLWIMCASGVAVVSLQIRLGKMISAGPENIVLSQLSAMLAFVLLETFMFYIFGTTGKKEPSPAAAPTTKPHPVQDKPKPAPVPHKAKEL